MDEQGAYLTELRKSREVKPPARPVEPQAQPQVENVSPESVPTAIERFIDRAKGLNVLPREAEALLVRKISEATLELDRIQK